MPRSSASNGAKQESKGAVKALAGKWGGEKSGTVVGNASWSDIDGHLLFTFITTIGNMRGAVMCGVDKQGVGLTLCVWLAGEKVLNKWYNVEKFGADTIHTDMEEFLTDLLSLPEAL